MRAKIKRTLKTGLFILGLCALDITLNATFIYADGGDDLNAVSHLLSYLQLDSNIFVFLGKGLANALYNILSFLTDMVESGFMLLARFNLFSAVAELSGLRDNLNLMIGTIFVIGITAVILVRMFKLEESMSVLYNALIVGMLIVTFSGFITLANEGRVAFTNFIDASITNDASTSERVFLDNTYDMLYLIDQATSDNKIVVNLREQGLTNDHLEFVKWDERLSKDDLGYKYRLNQSTFEKEAISVNDGTFGIGDERYLRYHTRYFNINTVLFITFFVYLVGLLKMSFLVYDLAINELLGKIGILKGLSDITQSGQPFMSFVQTLVSIMVLVVLMSIYPAIASGVLALSEETLPWVLKMLILFITGLVILNGSDFLDRIFGFEGGRRTMIAGFMLAKGAKSLAQKGKKALDFAGEKINDKRDEQKKLKDLPATKGDFDSQNEDNKGQLQAIDTPEAQVNEKADAHLVEPKGISGENSEQDNQAKSLPNIDTEGYIDAEYTEHSENNGSDKTVPQDSKKIETQESPESKIKQEETPSYERKGFDEANQEKTKESPEEHIDSNEKKNYTDMGSSQAKETPTFKANDFPSDNDENQYYERQDRDKEGAKNDENKKNTRD